MAGLEEGQERGRKIAREGKGANELEGQGEQRRESERREGRRRGGSGGVRGKEGG